MIATLLGEDENLICIMAIMFFTFVGSFAKDYLLLFKYHTKIQVGRIIFSSITASIFAYLLMPLILKYLSIGGLIACSFIAGLSGFEMLDRISSFGKVFALLKFLICGHYDVRDLDDILNKNDNREKITKIIIATDNNEQIKNIIEKESKDD